jgi:hypothetical protein
MDRHGGRESLGYWDEEGVCKSAEPSSQSTVKASKREVNFHVESQRLSERTLPFLCQLRFPVALRFPEGASLRHCRIT